MTTKAKDIDSYLAAQPKEIRIALEKLRRIIKAAAPRAEEAINYRMPTFRYNGMLVCFAGFKNHCSFFPCSSKLLTLFKEELKDFSQSKGTIRFTSGKPLPRPLVKKIVKIRLQENTDKLKSK